MANPLSDLFDKLMSPVSALSGADRVAGTLAAISRTLFDGKMWRSLGWILLGLVLLLGGVLLLLRKPIEGAAGTAAKAALL
ncbi:MAG TPA: hypothetical protein VFB06_34395 [Streptosporangiaceae bacterium]|nr:hypothetical protein [Streptosporangiaceae bacterium]